MTDEKTSAPNWRAPDPPNRLIPSGAPLHRYPHEAEAHFLLRTRICDLMRQRGVESQVVV